MERNCCINGNNRDIRKNAREMAHHNNMSEKWHTAIICPKHKKGDKLQCNNYRGISLLNVCYKVLANILHRQLVPYAEESLGVYQCVFREGHSASDSLGYDTFRKNSMNLILICTY